MVISNKTFNQQNRVWWPVHLLCSKVGLGQMILGGTPSLDCLSQTYQGLSKVPWWKPKNAKMPLVGLLVLLVLVLGNMMGWLLTSWTLCPCLKNSRTVQQMQQNCCFHNIQTKPLHKTQNFWQHLEKESKNNLGNLIVVLEMSNMTHLNLRLMSKNASPTYRSSR